MLICNAEPDVGRFIQLSLQALNFCIEIIFLFLKDRPRHMKFKLNSHVLINLSLAFSDQVVAFGITQKEYLLEIASKFKVDYICLFLSFDWLVDMLTIMLPELLFHLVIKLRELTLKSTKCLLADGEAGQISFSLIYEVKAFLKTSIEATNIC